ncbi:MAG: DUF3592 domain-containing protein [Candidatus Sericytochromatia bacterium]
MKGRITAVFCGLIALGLLLLSLWLGMQQYHILSTWPAVKAKVSSHTVRMWAPANYHVFINFKYQVEDRPVSAQVHEELDSFWFRSAAPDLLARYAPGSEHTIHHHRRRVEDISYDAGYTLAFFRWPLLLGLIGLFFAVLALKPWLVKLLAQHCEDRWGRAPDKPKAFVDTLLGGALFLVAGLFLLVMVVRTLTLEYQSQSWSTTKAVVLDASNKGYYSTPYKGPTRLNFSGIVDLGYLIKGRAYRMPEKVAGSSSRDELARTMEARYAPGTRIDIRYNPANPYQIRMPRPLDLPVLVVLGLLGLLGAFIVGMICLVIVKEFKALRQTAAEEADVLSLDF